MTDIAILRRFHQQLAAANKACRQLYHEQQGKRARWRRRECHLHLAVFVRLEKALDAYLQAVTHSLPVKPYNRFRAGGVDNRAVQVRCYAERAICLMRDSLFGTPLLPLYAELEFPFHAAPLGGALNLREDTAAALGAAGLKEKAFAGAEIVAVLGTSPATQASREQSQLMQLTRALRQELSDSTIELLSGAALSGISLKQLLASLHRR